MFCNDLREKHEEEIHIKGVEAETMAVLLDYTYTSKVLITKQNVQKILEAASLFQVPAERFFCVDIATVLRKARLTDRPSESAVPELQSHFMSYWTDRKSIKKIPQCIHIALPFLLNVSVHELIVQIYIN